MANISAKRVLIDKTNARIVTYVSGAAFILIFSLVATKTLIGQAAYQNRVIGAKRDTVNQLKSDIQATTQLRTSYEAFNSTAQNVLGGNPEGTAQGDGNNSKITLDALPSVYDFPGLTTSLETLLQSQKVTISSISGTDDEANQAANQSSTSPSPIPMPFQVSVSGDYNGVQNVIGAFERSIRPIQIQTLTLTASQANNISLNISAQTFYQPAKSLNITKKVVQ